MSATQKKAKERQGLAKRISLQMGAAFIALAIVIVAVSARMVTNVLLEAHCDKLQQLVRREAAMADGDMLAEYINSGGVVTPEREAAYERLQRRLDSAKEYTPEVAYIYIFVPYEDHFVYLYDAVREGDELENLSAFGEVYEYGETEYTYLVPDVQNKCASEGLIYGADVGYGKSISSWAPVLDSNGNLVAMVEADYRINDIYMTIFQSIFDVALLLLAGLVLILAVCLGLVLKNVTTPLENLTHAVETYRQGNLQFSYNKEDEISRLSGAFKEMIQRIQRYIEEITAVTAEKERIGAELNVATQIQADMLPRIFPPFPDRPEMDIFASMTPAKEVGGDFYDFFLVDDDHLALVIADVSGKGVPAALFMVIAKTLIKNRAQMGGTPAEIMTDVNSQLCEGNDAELFVTVWLCILELSTGKAVAGNAGHEYPAIMRAGGNYELFHDRHSMAMAAMDGIRYRQYDFQLNPGDRLFVYTDGVPEATDADCKMYGTDRMLTVLNEDLTRAPQEQLHCVKADIDAFANGAPQFDDITMLAMYYNGPAAPQAEQPAPEQPAQE